MQAIIKSQGDMLAIQTPFNRDFINNLKKEIPHTDREWDSSSKSWLVDPLHEKKVVEITGRYFDIIDGRQKSTAEIEDAQIESEIARIKTNQEYILANQDRIEQIIEDLSYKIGRYSYGSKSTVRYGLAQDRALLQHSLSNAKQPVEELAELQVRGLAAAVRYLQENG